MADVDAAIAAALGRKIGQVTVAHTITVATLLSALDHAQVLPLATSRRWLQGTLEAIPEADASGITRATLEGVIALIDLQGDHPVTPTPSPEEMRSRLRAIEGGSPKSKRPSRSSSPA